MSKGAKGAKANTAESESPKGKATPKKKEEQEKTKQKEQDKSKQKEDEPEEEEKGSDNEKKEGEEGKKKKPSLGRSGTMDATAKEAKEYLKKNPIKKGAAKTTRTSKKRTLPPAKNESAMTLRSKKRGREKSTNELKEILDEVGLKKKGNQRLNQFEQTALEGARFAVHDSKRRRIIKH